MGMTVVFYDIIQTMPLGTAKPCQSLDELLQLSDFVTLHVPETSETKLMLGQKELETMKSGSYLINASRGSVVDIPALVSALKSDHLLGCAIDVYPVEPFKNGKTFESPLMGCKNTILTPHIGGSTEEAQSSIGIEVATALCKFINTGCTLSSVNFPEADLRAPSASSSTIRVINIHQNVPGVLKQINKILADFNIEKQYVDSREEIAYFMADVTIGVPSDLHQIHKALQEIRENIVTRILF